MAASISSTRPSSQPTARVTDGTARNRPLKPDSQAAVVPSPTPVGVLRRGFFEDSLEKRGPPKAPDSDRLIFSSIDE